MWNFLIKLVIVGLMSLALRPKAQTMKPTSMEDLTLPTTELGRTIVKIWGRRRVNDPHLGWYGDYKTEAIKK